MVTGGVHISNHSHYGAGLIELLLCVNIINNNKAPCPVCNNGANIVKHNTGQHGQQGQELGHDIKINKAKN